jgi:uncharacterized membrane protein YGL010W
MAARKTADEWFAEYGESHRHRANELIHWICLPVIFWSILGFFWSIPVPESWAETAPWFNWALVAIVMATFFYLRLSPPLSAGLLFFMSLCYLLIALVEIYSPWAVWKVCAITFIAAWIGLLIGHGIEGRRPSFLRGIAFQLIGPAWLMSIMYKRLGQKY